MENSFFQSQMEESNFLEEIRNWEHPPWYGSVQFKQKVTLIFLENQKGLFQHLMTHIRMPVKHEMIFGPCQETSKTAITLNQESNFTRREKNHSLIHWNTLTSSEHYAYKLGCYARKPHRWLLKIRWIKRFVWFLDSFTQFTLWSEKPPEGEIWSGGRLTKRQATSRPDHLWPELWTKLGRNANLREKHEWAIEKPKLDNSRRLRGSYFIDPEDKEFKETIKNARKKLETPMAPAMPCKTSKKSKHGETRGKTNDFNF